ncbi:DMT family transporter [Rubrimonas sp.]|uniref:DMT family transporter n=1 Tax=Rubrimonas sp. TaxID=2036015 RepID=UPI002FDEAC30
MTDAAAPATRAPDVAAVAMGIAFAVIWSSAFSSARIALLDAPPFLFLTARFAAAGLGAVAVALALGQRLPRGRSAWRAVAVFGLCQNALYLGLNFLAMTEVPAGLAAIVASALPLAVAALAWATRGERPSALGVLGLAVGFAGVLVVMGGRVQGGAPVWGLAACVGGALALAVATLSLRGASAGGGLLMVVGLQMLVGAAALAPVALALETTEAVRWTPRLGLAFVYIALVPGIAATLLWFGLVRRIGAGPASAFHFLNPALGVGIAALALGEPATWVDAAGVAVVTVGIACVQIAARRDRAPTPPPDGRERAAPSPAAAARPAARRPGA